MAQGDLKGTLNGGTTSTTGPITATGSVAVSVGDLVVAVVTEFGTLTANTVTDNLGHTYTAQNAGTNSGNTNGRAYYKIITTAGTLTTVSCTVTDSGQDWAMSVAVLEGSYSGIGANPANGTDGATPFDCPSSGVLPQATGTVIGWAAIVRGQTNTAATSPNLLAVNKASASNAVGSCSVAVGYQTTSATTAVAPQFTNASGTINSGVQGTMSFNFTVAAGSGAGRLVNGGIVKRGITGGRLA